MTHATRRELGDYEIHVLTDGEIAFPPDYFPNATETRIAEILKVAGEEGIRTNFNAVTIRRGSARPVLIDTGPRDLFGPACGNLHAGLKEAGLAPGDVGTLFLTHLHPDHAAGSITAEGAAVFPEAELVLTEAEHRFWSDPAGVSGADQTLKDWLALAGQVLAAYGDRLRLIGPGDEIAPGLSVLDLPGHTPGHAGWRLSSGSEQLVHVGDIIHAPVLQAADPDISVVFDMDVGTARATRKRLLAELAADGILFTGGHLLAPAFVRARPGGAGYVLEAAD